MKTLHRSVATLAILAITMPVMFHLGRTSEREADSRIAATQFRISTNSAPFIMPRSGNINDVQEAFDMAKDGWGVILPPAVLSWTTAITTSTNREPLNVPPVANDPITDFKNQIVRYPADSWEEAAFGYSDQYYIVVRTNETITQAYRRGISEIYRNGYRAGAGAATHMLALSMKTNLWTGFPTITEEVMYWEGTGHRWPQNYGRVLIVRDCIRTNGIIPKW